MESLQCRPDDVLGQPHHQIVPDRPQHLEGGGEQPVEGSQHQVKQDVRPVDVEGGQAPQQEGDLHQVSLLPLERGGESQVQQGRQGEDNPALHPAWE